MTNKWRGVFVPVRKHILHTGDITNHLQLVDWDVEGNFLTAQVSFVHSPGETYTYEIEIEWDQVNEIDSDMALELVIEEIRS